MQWDAKCSHHGRHRSFRRAGEGTAALPAAEAKFPRGMTRMLSELGFGKICLLHNCTLSPCPCGLLNEAQNCCFVCPDCLCFADAFRHKIFFDRQVCAIPTPYPAKVVSSDRSTGDAPIIMSGHFEKYFGGSFNLPPRTSVAILR
jgi:hypothetical protein